VPLFYFIFNFLFSPPGIQLSYSISTGPLCKIPTIKMSDDNISDKHEKSTAEILHRYQTADSVLLPIPRDAFEKLYLSPKTPNAGKLRSTFGNPTPISLMGFLLAAMPTAMLTMGWRGAGGNGGAIL
jgi:hypothetical protein